MRIFFNIIVFLACIFAPWMLATTLLVIGLLYFRHWIEGILLALLLDMVMFGGIIGYHTLYIVLGFCALYYVTIRFKEMLRVS